MLLYLKNVLFVIYSVFASMFCSFASSESKIDLLSVLRKCKASEPRTFAVGSTTSKEQFLDLDRCGPCDWIMLCRN